MRLSQKITGFLHNGVSTLWYFAVMAVKENFRNYVGRAGRTELSLIRISERARAAIFWR